MPRNAAASKIGNSVISLLWQLRFHWNPDHNRFSSLSDTTVVAICQNLCFWRRSLCSNLEGIILGDPGTAVSRVGRKGAATVFKYGRKSSWVPTLTELFPKIQADAGSWLGTKNALHYCAQSANGFSWVLFVSLYTTAIVLSHLPGSFTKLVRARETFIFYFPNQKRKNYRWVEKTFRDAISRSNSICPENILFLTDHNVS